MGNRKLFDALTLLVACFIAAIYTTVVTALMGTVQSLASFYRYDRSEVQQWLEFVKSGADANPYFYILGLVSSGEPVGLEVVAFINLTIALFLIFRATSHLSFGLRISSILFVIPASLFFFTSGRTVTAMLLVCLLHLEWRNERRWINLCLVSALIYLIRPADLVIAWLVIGTLTSYFAPILIASIPPLIFPELGETILLEVLERNSGDQLLGNLSYRGLYDMPVSLWDLPAFVALPITRLPDFVSDPTVFLMLGGIGFVLLAVSRARLHRGTAAFLIVLLGVAAFSSNYSSLFRWVLPHAVAFLLIAGDAAKTGTLPRRKVKHQSAQEERSCVE